MPIRYRNRHGMPIHFHERNITMAQVKDVVCGMTVDTATAKHKSEYKGKIYYFCAPGCKSAFDKDPEKYLDAEESGAMDHEHH
jgi:YHS domain-containing protein